jgi:hypothetical protein
VTQTSPYTFAPAPQASPPRQFYQPGPGPLAAPVGQVPAGYVPWGSAAVLPQPFAPFPPSPNHRRRRVSVIALVVVSAVLVVGSVASDISHKPDPQPVVVRKRPVATAPSVAAAGQAPATPKKAAVPPPAAVQKPAPKPAGVPLGGKWVQVTSDNSGTVGAPYRIAAPKGYVTEYGKRGGNPDNDHMDLFLTDAGQTHELGIFSFAWEGLPEGPLRPETVKLVRGGWLRNKKRIALPGTSVATIGGVRAAGFDYTYVMADGIKYHGRVVVFGHAGTMYSVLFYAPATTFAKRLVALERIAATMTFTGPNAGARGETAST